MPFFLLGRLIFGGFFLFNGLNHFLSYSMMTQYAAAKGVPFAGVLVPIAGALLVFGGASIVLGWRPDLGVGAVVLFLLPVTVLMHNFWAEAGAERMNDTINFLKNFALVGATLMLVAIPQPWPYSVETRGTFA